MREAPHTEFEELRPRLLMLLELHRNAATDVARATLVDVLQDVFLATAWHVAQDLLEHGWTPGVIGAPNSAKNGLEDSTQSHLRLVGGLDAA